MVSLDGKVSASEIMTPLTYSPDNAQQLPLIRTVSAFGRVQFSAVIADWLQTLAEILLKYRAD